jgi:hypothetical protein
MAEVVSPFWKLPEEIVRELCVDWLEPKDTEGLTMALSIRSLELKWKLSAQSLVETELASDRYLSLRMLHRRESVSSSYQERVLALENHRCRTDNWDFSVRTDTYSDGRERWVLTAYTDDPCRWCTRVIQVSRNLSVFHPRFVPWVHTAEHHPKFKRARLLGSIHF